MCVRLRLILQTLRYQVPHLATIRGCLKRSKYAKIGLLGSKLKLRQDFEVSLNFSRTITFDRRFAEQIAVWEVS